MKRKQMKNNILLETRMWLWVSPFLEVGLIAGMVWLLLSYPFKPSIFYLVTMLFMIILVHWQSFVLYRKIKGENE